MKVSTLELRCEWGQALWQSWRILGDSGPSVRAHWPSSRVRRASRRQASGDSGRRKLRNPTESTCGVCSTLTRAAHATGSAGASPASGHART